MCGRARLSSDVSEIKLVFSIPPERPTPNFPPSWNVAPTDSLPVVRYDTKAGQRSYRFAALGPDPLLGQGHQGWLRQHQRQGRGHRQQAGLPQIVRAPPLPRAGRQLLRMEKTATGKQPYALALADRGIMALADRGIMALAGVWENWHAPGGEWLRSFAIVTTTPNELCGEIHNRMPVILKPETWPAWLGEEPADVAELKSLLAPYPADEMICWPVSARVGNVRNNDATLIEPLAAVTAQ
jgi:putative SOS response-associated peptidase YedK